MPNPSIDQEIDLLVHSIGTGGEGVGSWNNFPIFVDGVLPGELATVRVTQSQRTFARARLQQLITTSPSRVSPICPLFYVCGGCQIMHLAYSEQLQYKQNAVYKALSHYNLESISQLPCKASPSQIIYRNKIQLPVRPNSEGGCCIGLYAKNSHDVIDIDHCYVHCQLGEFVYNIVRGIVHKSSLKAYDPKSGSGHLRYILIKTAEKAEQVLVTFITFGQVDLQHIANELIAKAPQVKGVVHNINTNPGNFALGKESKTLSGTPFIEEKLSGITFRISPASFFQINTAQAENLYNQALAWADLRETDTILDAYCGIGTLSLQISRHVKHVVGIESVPEAIEDAKTNAEINNIHNSTFLCGNAEELIKTIDNVDLIFVNPPRKGCDPTFIREMLRLQPRKIIYISCNPETLARDLKLLRHQGYAVEKIQPFDMFPQTVHVECVACIYRI